MSYLVLARKYRPLDFTSVSGQEHVTRTLQNSIKRNKIAHAYLFAGPRGVGKTSIARIFSKALNCEKGPTAEPCLECSNCIGITQGTSLAVREIDGASHNSVDNVRELIDSFRSLPAPGSRYKIYIIDEVHMLSTSAFNALLKSLEEPPPHTVFILATTEIHKIPETVISRCQRHDFRALPLADIDARLREIAKAEKIKVDQSVFRMISRLSDGSMRDAQSLLDRVQAFCDGAVTESEASRVLGTVERRILYKLSDAVLRHKSDEALLVLEGAFATGVDTALFLRDFASHWRELLIAKCGGEASLNELGASEEDKADLVAQVKDKSTHDIQDLSHLARTGADNALRSAFPKYALEALVVRMSTREDVQEIGKLLSQIGSGGSLQKPIQHQAQHTAPAPRKSEPQMQHQAAERAHEAASPRTSAAPIDKLDWGKFVKHVTAAGPRMMSEPLKRLVIEEFSPRVLQARGADFSIKYLEDKDNKKKLEAALEEYSGHKNWQIRLNAAGKQTAAEPGSLVHQESIAENEKNKELERSIAEHPKIKSLQRVFPGSKIEPGTIKG